MLVTIQISDITLVGCPIPHDPGLPLQFCNFPLPTQKTWKTMEAFLFKRILSSL